MSTFFRPYNSLQNINLEMAIATQREKIADNNCDIKRCRTAITELRAMIHTLDLEVNALTQQQLEPKNKRLKLQLESISKTLSSQQHQQHSQLSRDIKRLEQKIQTKKGEKQERTETLTAYQDALADCKSICTGLENRLTNLNNELIANENNPQLPHAIMAAPGA